MIMDTINEFLKTPFFEKSDTENLNIDTGRVQKLNRLFAGYDYKPATMHLLPRVKRNQIWSIKNEYMDFEGHLQKAIHPFMVLVSSDPELLDNETEFVRVFPISPFVEKASSNDIICSDTSIVGFPFLIESWNGQPVLTEILDKYVTNYIVDKNITEEDHDTSSDFQAIEISNAKFLNHSILAYMSDASRSKVFSFSIDINYGGNTKSLHMPILNVANPKLIALRENEEYAVAAKSGCVLTENDCIEFSNADLPFRLEIRKKSGSYLLTVIPQIEITLTNSCNEEICGNKNAERIVFSNLKKGLYEIKTPLSNEILTIRIK
jgi:hypothetical protein